MHANKKQLEFDDDFVSLPQDVEESMEDSGMSSREQLLSEAIRDGGDVKE